MSKIYKSLGTLDIKKIEENTENKFVLNNGREKTIKVPKDCLQAIKKIIKDNNYTGSIFKIHAKKCGSHLLVHFIDIPDHAKIEKFYQNGVPIHQKNLKTIRGVQKIIEDFKYEISKNKSTGA